MLNPDPKWRSTGHRAGQTDRAYYTDLDSARLCCCTTRSCDAEAGEEAVKALRNTKQKVRKVALTAAVLGWQALIPREEGWRH